MSMDDTVPRDGGELEEGEVPAGYTARGGSERCAECMYFVVHAVAAENPPGDCTVHGPPPYLVVAGGWCPAWEPQDGDLPVFG